MPVLLVAESCLVHNPAPCTSSHWTIGIHFWDISLTAESLRPSSAPPRDVVCQSSQSLCPAQHLVSCRFFKHSFNELISYNFFKEGQVQPRSFRKSVSSSQIPIDSFLGALNSNRITSGFPVPFLSPGLWNSPSLTDWSLPPSTFWEPLFYYTQCSGMSQGCGGEREAIVVVLVQLSLQLPTSLCVFHLFLDVYIGFPEICRIDSHYLTNNIAEENTSVLPSSQPKKFKSI